MTLNSNHTEKFLPGDVVEILPHTDSVFDDRVGARGVVIADQDGEDADKTVVVFNKMTGRMAVPNRILGTVAK